ncbi:MAG: hypothetical protein JSW50_02045 [Candidatus Latescibacterota bacterium]|nr:MAG: hypothetical protein JSW50_02045 [Candidatus Latescibacterota bacterium]
MSGKLRDEWKNRLSIPATMLFGVVAFLLCFAMACHHAMARGRANLPGTTVGQCAVAYFNAFNSGSDEKMRAFVEKHRSPAFLEVHPADERAAHQNRLRGIFGELAPVRVVLSLEFRLTLVADPKISKDAVVMRFRLEKEAPPTDQLVMLA